VARHVIAYPTVIGAVLREYRERLGLSQERIGFRASLHRNYISDAERGRRNISITALGQWLRALDISWEEFGAAMDAALLKRTRALRK
jgi:transcriptional regulator with XRE-family HTH domain